MANGNVSTKLAFKAKLRGAEAAFHQAHGRFGSSIRLWAVRCRSLAYSINPCEFDQIGCRGYELRTIVGSLSLRMVTRE